MFGFVTETKVWGHTTKIGHSPKSGLHVIMVHKGSFCSKHYHENKHNGFVVIEGNLTVRVWDSALDDSTMAEHKLEADGSSFVVQCNKLHQFYSEEGARVVEFYLPAEGVDVDPEDIIRLSRGGVDDGEE